MAYHTPACHYRETHRACEAMIALKEHYSEAIEAAISKAKDCRDLVTVEAFDGTEAYAHPHREGRIAWGVNTEKDGINILRGIRRPDGADEAELIGALDDDACPR